MDERGTSLQRGPLLSDRERQVLHLLAEGCQRKEIAAILHVSPWTVLDTSERVRRKLGARNAAHAVALGFQHGLI